MKINIIILPNENRTIGLQPDSVSLRLQTFFIINETVNVTVVGSIIEWQIFYKHFHFFALSFRQSVTLRRTPTRTTLRSEAKRNGWTPQLEGSVLDSAKILRSTLKTNNIIEDILTKINFISETLIFVSQFLLTRCKQTATTNETSIACRRIKIIC